MWNIIYLLTGFAFFLLLFFVMLFKKSVNNKETKIYKYLIIANGLEYLFEITLQIFVRNLNLESFLVTLFCRLYLCSILICYGVFSHYTSLICLENDNGKNNKIQKISKIINNTWCLIGVVLIFVLPFNKHYDASKMFVYGKAVDTLKLFLGVYLLSWIILSLKNLKTIIQKEYIPILTIIATIILSVIIQSVDPSILVSTVFGTIICYTMYHTIENPDVKMLRELHKSKKISDNANEEKTMFLYNMTQEVKSLVDDINNNLDLILAQNDINEVYNYTRDIKTAVSSFETINNNEFDLSNVNSETIKSYVTKYNIKNIIMQIINIYKEVCESKHINFITNIDSNLPEYLFGDGIGLKRVITSILNNSTTYINEGYVELNVNVILKKDVCRLMITIEDSGIGIKSDDIEKIILSDSSLGVANKTINDMDGRMIISSNYGSGTKIKIILDQKIDLNNYPIYDKYAKDFDYLRILAVDDSSYGIEIIKKLLKDKNVIFDSCLTGKECVQKIKNNEYDLVLLDEQLAQITGNDLAIRIKEQTNKNVPLVLMTKDAEYMNKNKTDSIFNSIILKPLKRDALYEVLNKIKSQE